MSANFLTLVSSSITVDLLWSNNNRLVMKIFNYTVLVLTFFIKLMKYHKNIYVRLNNDMQHLCSKYKWRARTTVSPIHLAINAPLSSTALMCLSQPLLSSPFSHVLILGLTSWQAEGDNTVSNHVLKTTIILLLAYTITCGWCMVMSALCLTDVDACYTKLK